MKLRSTLVTPTLATMVRRVTILVLVMPALVQLVSRALTVQCESITVPISLVLMAVHVTTAW